MICIRKIRICLLRDKRRINRRTVYKTQDRRVNPITLTVEGTFSGYAINEIYVEGDYAYLATTDDNKEVVILDISSLPYTEVGYVDTPDSWNAYSVFVKGNIGYVAHSTYVSTFNLDQKTGKRDILNTINVSLIPWIATVSQIYVKDNYLYGVLNWGLV